MNETSPLQDRMKSKITIKKEIEKLRGEIRQRKERINFLDSLLKQETKELSADPKIILVVGEYAKDWIEENDTMFFKKRLITHEEFGELKKKPKSLELVIVLDYTHNLESILAFSKTYRIQVDFLNPGVKKRVKEDY